MLVGGRRRMRPDRRVRAQPARAGRTFRRDEARSPGARLRLRRSMMTSLPHPRHGWPLCGCERRRGVGAQGAGPRPPGPVCRKFPCGTSSAFSWCGSVRDRRARIVRRRTRSSLGPRRGIARNGREFAVSVASCSRTLAGWMRALVRYPPSLTTHDDTAFAARIGGGGSVADLQWWEAFAIGLKALIKKRSRTVTRICQDAVSASNRLRAKGPHQHERVLQAPVFKAGKLSTGLTRPSSPPNPACVGKRPRFNPTSGRDALVGGRSSGAGCGGCVNSEIASSCQRGEPPRVIVSIMAPSRRVLHGSPAVDLQLEHHSPHRRVARGDLLLFNQREEGGVATRSTPLGAASSPMHVPHPRPGAKIVQTENQIAILDRQAEGPIARTASVLLQHRFRRSHTAGLPRFELERAPTSRQARGSDRTRQSAGGRRLRAMLLSSLVRANGASRDRRSNLFTVRCSHLGRSSHPQPPPLLSPCSIPPPPPTCFHKYPQYVSTTLWYPHGERLGRS